MNWYKIKYFRTYNTQEPPVSIKYAMGDTPDDAIVSIDGLGTGLTFEINSVPPSEVPPVRRGLAEATVEQLRDELRRRGWKVVLK
jgi:hypothetical protein